MASICIFSKKTLFSTLIIASLSSASLAMEEDGEGYVSHQLGKPTYILPDDTSETNLFNPKPSSLIGRGTHWLWNYGGTWLDRLTIAGTTYVGAYLGNLYDQTVSIYVADVVGAQRRSASFNREQMILLYNDKILSNTRKNILDSGTLQYGFPYDDIATCSGAVLGYFTGVGITKARMANALESVLKAKLLQQ